jgi:hypothetical protein
MTSSYSTDLKLELMVTGENAGTWGDKTNTNLNLIQQAIAGYESITITDSATTALVMSNAALSNARNMIIKFATITLTGATTVTIPDGIEKFYIFDCSAITDANNLTIKTASGSGFSPTTAGAASPKIFAAYSDGTNLTEISLNTLGGTIGTAQLEAASVTAPILASNAVTTDKILQSNVTTAKLAASAVTGNNIAQSTITQTKLAADSVGSNQLIATGVTAQEYTSATITVDADGRITAASSGGGASNFEYVLFSSGGSGNVTAPANVSKVQAFLWGGGGGGGAGDNNPPESGRPGGAGGFGYWTGSLAGPATVPYSIGGGGNGGNHPNGTGNAGSATNFSNFTANGGGGGSRNASGSTGTSPGATGVGNTTSFWNNQPGKGGPGAPGASGSPGTPGSTGAAIALFNQG